MSVVYAEGLELTTLDDVEKKTLNQTVTAYVEVLQNLMNVAYVKALVFLMVNVIVKETHLTVIMFVVV